jgi:hypothetical protein
MATATCPREIQERTFGATLRRDAWWVEPAIYFTLLSAFVIYSTWAAIWGARHISFGPYLTPMYSPLLLFDLPTVITPAMLVLWAPAGFRLTCYYYRKAYYRSFAAQPIACGVGKPWKTYNGERRLLLFQNLHRFFAYLAVLFIFILGYDAIVSLFGWSKSGIYEPITAGAAAGAHHPHHALGGRQFGVGIGSLVLTLNVILLAGYTFGCHSLRHLVGGCIDCPSRAILGKARHRAWKGVTVLNEKHMWWAWTSLIWVGFTDLYVRACSMGWISAEFDRLF